jgi:hypothetical protein
MDADPFPALRIPGLWPRRGSGPRDNDSPQAGSLGNPDAERWNLHFQATSVGQHHGSFYSKYEGENSLPAHPENRIP